MNHTHTQETNAQQVLYPTNHLRSGYHSADSTAEHFQAGTGASEALIQYFMLLFVSTSLLFGERLGPRPKIKQAESNYHGSLWGPTDPTVVP